MTIKNPDYLEIIENLKRKLKNNEVKDKQETYVIGDANGVAQALEAVRAAYELGYKL